MVSTIEYLGQVCAYISCIFTMAKHKVILIDPALQHLLY